MTEPLARDPRSTSTLDWRVDVPLLTEPLLLAVYLKATVLSALLMGSLLTFLVLVTGNAEAIGPMWVMTGIASVAVVGLGLIATALLLRNRMSMRFVVDDRGVEQFVIDLRASAASSAAVALGSLAGSASTTGVGLLARSQSRKSAAWGGLVSARFHPRRNAVALRNSWRTVMLVFCTPRNYAEVAARIEKEMAARAGRTRARPNPIPGLLLRTVLTVLACLPFFVLPYPFVLDLLAPIFTLCFALAALWLVPLLAWATILGLGWMWAEIFLRATVDRRSILDGSIYRSWERMSADDGVPLVVSALATAYLLWQASSLLRGRVPSALAGDEDELDMDDPPADTPPRGGGP